MKHIKIEITGSSPILLHSYPMVEIKGLEKMEPRQQAEHHVYRDPETQELYFPGVNIQRALVAGAAYCGRGVRSIVKQVAASISINPERVGFGTRDFLVDSRSVVIPKTKGRVMRHRARLDEWRLAFVLAYDATLISAKQMREVVDYTGSRVGIGDFRPACKGWFGRFDVTSWQPE